MMETAKAVSDRTGDRRSRRDGSRWRIDIAAAGVVALFLCMSGALPVAADTPASAANEPPRKPSSSPATDTGTSATVEVGQPLAEALAMLRRGGLSVVFSDRLVPRGLKVLRRPESEDPRAMLDELLTPHGLMIREVAQGRLLVIRASPHPGAGAPSLPSEEEPAATFEAEQAIEVVATHPWILGEEISAYTLDREALDDLPEVGNDTLRRLSHLPGTASNDHSAEVHVRGGRADEVMVRLDGHEVVAPYHLQDYGNALSSLANEAIGEARFFTGGFPAEFGDRMGGVLDLTTTDPGDGRHRELAISPLDLAASQGGRRADGRRAGLVVLRGGSLELPFRVADEEDNPRYADLFAKLEVPIGERQTLRAHLLAARDWLDFREIGDEGAEAFRTTYDSVDTWLSHQRMGSRRSLFVTRLSFGNLGRDRRGERIMKEDEEEDDFPATGFSLTDERRLDSLALAVDAQWRLGEGEDGEHHLRWGGDVRRLEVDYDYESRRLQPGPLPAIRHFDQRFDGEQLATYLADRWRSGRWTVDLGLRLDRNSVLDDNHFLSPRLSVGIELSERSLLRANLGRYTQSQRLYELQVEDGETELSRSERTEQASLGFEHLFANRSGDRGMTLRLELHHRQIDNPRARWENLLEPVGKVPELASDRVRIEPTSSRSSGAELFLGGPAGRSIEWFASYAYSRAEDRVDGRDVPRRTDQPHTLRLDLAWSDPARRWRIGLAFQAHTGWPTTAVSGRLAEGEDEEPVVERVFGPLNGERFPDYARLDLGVRRFWKLPKGELMAWLTVQNLAGRENLRGFVVSFEIEDGQVIMDKAPKDWGGIWPSFGVRWSF